MSEELKETESNEEADSVQETLEATESDEEDVSTPAESNDKPDEPKVPLHEHTALRARAQQAELAAARLAGELEATRRIQASSAPSTKSPLELEMERQSAQGIDEEDMTISPKVIRDENAYQRQLAAKMVQEQTDAQFRAVQNASINQARIAHEDWQNVIDAGQNFLTKAELAYIEKSENAGEASYEMCQRAIARSKPQAVTESVKPVAPKKPSGPEKEKEKVPTQEEILAGIDNIDPMVLAVALL